MGNLTEALAVTVLGVSVVFLVLIILMCVLYAMKLIAPKENAQEAAQPTPAAPAVQKTDDAQLVAVLAAAIAASGEVRPGYELNIKSYRRVSDGASAWTKASR